MRVITCGSRGWNNRALIQDVLADLPGDTTIVVGYNPENDTPKGADRIVWQEAQKAGLTLEPHPAEWERYGKRAGFVRNEDMAVLGADLCIAFWDGASSGTVDMMERAAQHGIPIECIDKRFPNRERQHLPRRAQGRP